MCHDPADVPPPPPRSGRLLGSERLVLEAGDGARPAATLATAGGADTGVVVLPDVRGLHPFYERFAEALADAGVSAVAVDPYSRTAGTAHRDGDFDPMPHREAATDAGLREDTDAGLQLLGENGCRARFVLGFCFGGRSALLQAERPDLAGTIGFYGRIQVGLTEGVVPLERAEAGHVTTPVLAIFGGGDPYIPADVVERYRRALQSCGIDHEVVVVDRAPHSFFDREADRFRGACQDVWARVLAFVDARSPRAELGGPA